MGGVFYSANGIIYLWGNISNYVVSYFHYIGDKNATSKLSMGVLPICMVVGLFVAPWGPYLSRRMNVKIIMLLGCLCLIGGNLVSSLCTNWYIFLFFYAIV